MEVAENGSSGTRPGKQVKLSLVFYLLLQQASLLRGTL